MITLAPACHQVLNKPVNRWVAEGKLLKHAGQRFLRIRVRKPWFKVHQASLTSIKVCAHDFKITKWLGSMVGQNHCRPKGTDRSVLPPAKIKKFSKTKDFLKIICGLTRRMSAPCHSLTVFGYEIISATLKVLKNWLNLQTKTFLGFIINDFSDLRIFAILTYIFSDLSEGAL